MKKRIGLQDYELELPWTMRIHPVFHVSQLEPHPPDELPDRRQEAPPPVIVDGEPEYEIAEILDCKRDRRRKVQLVYRIRWEGYEGAPDEFADLLASELEHSPDLVREFHEKHPAAPGSYKEFLRYIQRT